MRESILMTIKYFDMFDYSLQKEEIWKWLFIGKAADRDVFEKELDELVKNKVIGQKNDYYFLANRSDIIKVRQIREVISLKKIKKAQRVARLLGLVPGVKMIAIVSNLGYLNAEVEADIDFFIVTGKNRIWSVRFWCVMLMKLLRQRPNKKTMKNKICLSYFVTEDNLNLEGTKIAEPDMHLIYLLSQHLLIYDQAEIWQRFIDQNKWINKYLPNFKYTELEKKFAIRPSLVWLKELMSSTILGFEEKFYKNIQLKKMATELKETMNRGDKKVIVNDQILKLHTNDKRGYYNKMMNK